MEEEKKLYPLKFSPLEDSYSWGDEEFRLADLGYRDSIASQGWLAGNTISEIMDMYMDRVCGESVFNIYGRQFPFEVKSLKVKSTTPLLVHPDDTTAGPRYDFLGKVKAWYILQADDNAAVYLGFNKEMDASTLCSACADGSVKDILNRKKVKAGDRFIIKPGCVHAAEGQMTIIEVSESSPLDFCLCNWGKDAEGDEFDESLNLIDALDLIDYSPACKCEQSQEHEHHHEHMVEHLAELDEFEANLVKLTDPLHIYSSEFDSAIVYSVLKGEVSVQIEVEGLGAVPYVLKEGETLLVPAEISDFILAPLDVSSQVLEVYMPKREIPDPYINPDAAARLDDDDDCCEDEECHHHLNS